MSRHFLLYWRPETVEFHLACDYLLRNAGSNQLERVNAGDTLWIVTTGESYQLGLAGRLRVGAVVTLAEATTRLGTADLWPSRLQALAAPGTAEPMRGVNLAEVAPDLTFVDSVVNKLVVKNDGQVNPQLLKTMLELSSGSAAMLERLWLLTSLRKAL
jgi:hypothetical protein